MLIDYLNFNLCSVSLPSAMTLAPSRQETRLSRICDALCAAYADEDFALMEIVTDFLT